MGVEYYNGYGLDTLHGRRRAQGQRQRPVIAKFAEIALMASQRPEDHGDHQIREVLRLSRHLQALFNQLEALPEAMVTSIESQSIIIDIIKRAAELPPQNDLFAFLSRAPATPEWPLAAKRGLSGTITKIGRYYTVHKDLI